MLDWLIIGGGIHGTHLAHVLVNQCGFPADAVRILDPHDHLLATWNKRTNNTGMRYLRSPRVHHIDLAPISLTRFAQEQYPNVSDLWIDPYSRPSYQLFQQHCQHVIDSYQLERLHIQRQALTLHRFKNGWCVDTENNRMIAQRVLLTTGRQQPLIPDWAKRLIAQNAPLQHVLDMTFDRRHIGSGKTAMVVGGGISAGQIALKLMNDHRVTITSQHPFRHHDFDSGPCWLGPKCLDSFEQSDYQRRRVMIGEARQTGTLAHDVYTDIHTALQSELIHHHQGEIIAADMIDDNRITLTSMDGTTHITDHVILATGFQAIPPMQTWLADTITRHHLQIANCGYPILDHTLCWADGLYVSGSLAELEMGPASANIAGARAAGERLLQIKLNRRKNATRTF